MVRSNRWALFPLLLVAACGGTNDGGAPAAPDDGIRDLRVEVPAADPNYIDFVGAEVVLEPGEDRMICTHFRYDGEDIAFSLQDTLQGKFGHHAILLGAKEPLPPGTMEDCTDAASMAKFDPFTVPSHELPAGRGTFLPKGKVLVLQSHYLNSGAVPIRVRDVVRLKTMPIAAVEKWASMYVTNDYGFELAPHGPGESQFDCVVPEDTMLLLIGGHMHERGTRFETLIGADEASLESVYLVDPWVGDYRDNPPVTLYFENPRPLPAGSIVRTHCSWNNTEMKPSVFPDEMCSTFGFVEGPKEPIRCFIGGDTL